MTGPLWLGAKLHFYIHSEQLAVFGGSAGVGDHGMPGSALNRPVDKHAYGETDLSMLAAAYAFGLARNHPFIDGDKPVAFAALIVFLGLNRGAFRVEPAHATASMLALAAGAIDVMIFTAR